MQVLCEELLGKGFKVIQPVWSNSEYLLRYAFMHSTINS
jgi:hypothetical protein